MSVLRLPRISSFRAFEHPGYFAVWAGSLVSNVGTWMETVALGVYVTEVTGKAEWTGGVVALSYLPGLVLSPLGGALADRFDRRTFLAIGILLQGLLAVLLTVLAFTQQLTVPAVAVISFFNGCINMMMGPAFNALLAELVPPEDLHSAMSLSSAQFNLGRVIGPILAAAVLGAGGIAWALLVNALSFLAVPVALSRVRPPPRLSAPSTTGLWADIARGAHVAREDPGIRLMLMTTFAVALLVAPFIGLVPVFAIRVFGQGAGATSLLVTCQGAGAVTAAVAVGALLDAFGRKRVLAGVLLVLGPVATLYWLSPTLPLASISIFLLGASYLMALSGIHTICQVRAPPALRARVSSLYGMVLNGGYALGVWLLGALADRLSVRSVTATASLLFLVLMVSFRMLRPRAFDATEA
ncbi:Predicted arabinose efflux permease, MFS family [Stigmatella aurantiaca]|uniref:Predicted arabinose efflux permease, MFS family n=1 Tax=Stigmatella aurantiaca TaxID=41 RepID=A0A1H7LUD2_STIAU|nr:MFS transporter [Stigmatella aurantiaca]SEL02105.1 Predicted arabinose efflux permease, MFS family [Stigmatella aurantiaca]